MKMKKLFLPAILGFVFLFSGCGNREMKKDAERIGDAMCRNIEVMSKMKAADPADSAALTKLRSESEKLQAEMSVIYKEFDKKYGEKSKDPKFTKDFNRELRKAMLNCSFLSKEDRELFQKELGE